eukprot:7387473-Prymnesium_polylepis.1
MLTNNSAAENGTVSFGLSLNGQQFLAIEDFALYEPPTLHTLSPRLAFSNGGTLVNVSGAHLSGGDNRRCTFADAVTTATLAEDGGSVRCMMPSLDATGVRRHVALDFDEPTAIASQADLSGLAELRAGALRIAHGGSLQLGAIVLRPFEGMPALLDFHIRFDLLLGGGSFYSGPGVSINYGPVNASHLDESGGGHAGLTVSLRSGYANVVEVRLRSRLLISSSLRGTLVHQAWLPVAVSHTAAGLQVRCRGRLIIDGLQLDGWSPLPHWRVALAARSSDSGDAADEHWVHHVRVESGSLRWRAELPVRVSLNAQQFHPTDEPAPTLAFQAPPMISSAMPPRGAVTGGTRLRLLGLHFGGGYDHRCRFGRPFVEGESLTDIAA